MTIEHSTIKCERSSNVRTQHSPAAAAERILQASQYRAIRQLCCEFEGGVLTVSGRLPNFYLKQLAQTLIRDVEGVLRIVNEVRVPK